ncbi:hypothetical protein [Planosporangium mesophilum]|uniref:Uncharacterized protein n=1 Tax=Planosporangium mesophilum TaxID=689768 RepID=A0A8J3X3Y1_9ACTN|nr:hypothetical protein [Planosporangium mesophilum]NJC86800.1 hypothetical protein [Planosporangium mesophilum]GII26496.1 hypothetical protein Pme01_60930 [Planosporangium mesophilum]
MSARDRHTTWCAAGHRCGLGEHRADPITLTVPGAGTAVITRVRSADGAEHADIRLSVALPADEPAARLRLAALLTHLRTLIGPARTSGRAA